MQTLRALTYFMRAKLFARPYFCHYYITKSCNLQCKKCNVPNNFRQLDVEKRGELSLDEVSILASRLKRIGVFNVLLTGGEPFARRDLSAIVRLLVSEGFSVRIVTNGTKVVTRERLLETIDAGIDALEVSLDSLDPEIHDEMTGQEGTLEQIQGTLEFAAQHLKGGMVIVLTVVSSMNIRELPRIAEYVTSKGAYSVFQPIHLAPEQDEAGVSGMPDRKEMLIGEKQNDLVDRVYGELIQMKKKGYNILSSNRFLKDSIEYFKTGQSRWNCDAYQYYITICPHGEVLPCLRFEDCEWLERMNILDEGFVEKYRSKEMNKKAEVFRKRCPGCVLACYREMSSLFGSPSVFWEMAVCHGKRSIRHALNRSRGPACYS